MITFAAPAFLLAGVLAALVPLVLHLIRRRPPTRAPLPTERFLTPDPRTAVRVSRPTDPLLLALRMLLLVLAGAAFARPAWFPAAKGTREVVLLDRGAGMGSAWPQAVAEARRRLIGPDGRARGELVTFDSTGTAVPARRVASALAEMQSASPAKAESRYAAALEAIPAAARELRGADSVRVTLITRPRWGAWSDGLAAVRRAAWPGAIEIVAVPGAADTARHETATRGHTVLLAGDRNPEYPVAALEAVGWTVDVLQPRQSLPSPAPALVVIAAPVDASAASEVLNAARAGATVLVDAAAGTSLGAERLWTGTRADSTGGAMWFDGDLHAAGAVVRMDGGPAAGTKVVAAWDDGRPAAAARRVGSGCIVFAATELGRGDLVLDAAYPRVIDRLAHGCESPVNADAAAPLDAGARAVLRGSGPAVVAAGAVPGSGGGVRLGRWVMALALLVALVETFFAYRRRKAA